MDRGTLLKEIEKQLQELSDARYANALSPNALSRLGLQPISNTNSLHGWVLAAVTLPETSSSDPIMIIGLVTDKAAPEPHLFVNKHLTDEALLVIHDILKSTLLDTRQSVATKMLANEASEKRLVNVLNSRCLNM